MIDPSIEARIHDLTLEIHQELEVAKKEYETATANLTRLSELAERFPKPDETPTFTVPQIADTRTAISTPPVPQMPLGEAVRLVLAGKGNTGVEFRSIKQCLIDRGFSQLQGRGGGVLNAHFANLLRMGIVRKDGDRYIFVGKK